MPYTQYDPDVLVKFAGQLYARARTLVILYAVVGALFGLPLGVFVGGFVAQALGFLPDPPATLGGALAGALVLGLLGGLVGQARAFVLKVQAQTALCQVAIEENTRPRR